MQVVSLKTIILYMFNKYIFSPTFILLINYIGYYNYEQSKDFQV